MPDLIRINNQDITATKELIKDSILYQMLSKAVLLANEDIDKGMDFLMDDVRNMAYEIGAYDNRFRYVRFYILRGMLDKWWLQNKEKEKNEFYWHDIFKKYVDRLIVGAKLTCFEIIKEVGVPDFFVSVNGKISPVEIKKDGFNNTAKRQLKRYMHGYKMMYGYAIGKKLTCKLDSKMIFIPLSKLEQYEEEIADI